MANLREQFIDDMVVWLAITIHEIEEQKKGSDANENELQNKI